MPIVKILVAEDEEISMKLLQAILDKTHYYVVYAKNGQEAFQELINNNYSILITDINMPIMDGVDLIKNVKNSQRDPVIIVQSAVQELDMIIEIMKYGVFDYLIKPVNKDDLLFKINRAEETYRLRKVNQLIDKEKDIRIKNQLNVNQSLSRMMSRDHDRFDKELFHNIRTGFSQGAGFGGLIALVSLISSQAKKEDNQYIIDASLMDLVIENAKMGEKALEAFQDIDNIIKMSMETERIHLSDFIELINNIKGNLADKLKLKNQDIKISENKYKNFPFYLDINRELFTRAFTEVLINAMKYSKNDSHIMIFFHSDDNYFNIAILNQSTKNDSGKDFIPDEYARLIFEPFFRLTKNVDERYGTLEFGLGLTITDKIIRKHGGKIAINTVQNYTDMDMDFNNLVNLEIALPIKQVKN